MWILSAAGAELGEVSSLSAADSNEVEDIPASDLPSGGEGEDMQPELDDETDSQHAAEPEGQPEVEDSPVPAVPAEIVSGVAEEHVPAELEVAAAAERPPPRASSSRQHISPDALTALSPLPYCRITMDKNVHRWVASWRPELSFAEWRGEYCNKTHTRSFTQATWRDKLVEVHSRAWQKWQLVADRLPLEGGAQTPGEVPEFVWPALEAEVLGLMPRKQY